LVAANMPSNNNNNNNGSTQQHSIQRRVSDILPQVRPSSPLASIFFWLVILFSFLFVLIFLLPSAECQNLSTVGRRCDRIRAARRPISSRAATAATVWWLWSSSNVGFVPFRV
jgi:preprotein translocase subunit SecY